MDQKELRQLESRCIQEWAPWCAARCPVHVDVRAMNAAIRKGDFARAAKVFRDRVPFPGVISHICDHPCQEVCRREAIDDGLFIRDLERAAIGLAPESSTRVPLLPGKGKRVAIVGSGLSGLTAATDLAKKGYGVTIFEASDKLGGTLWEYPDSELPREVIERDLDGLKQLKLEIQLGSTLGKDIPLSDLEARFDAIYLGVGSHCTLPDDIATDEQGLVKADPVTFQTNRPGVFVGGSAVSGAGPRSPIRSISDGRRAAISIDRHMQKVSLTASRDNEGAYKTRLFTSIERVDLRRRVPPTDAVKGYTTEEAIQEASRCLHCECMECVKVCDYLETFKGYPKKYVRQIYNNLSILAGQRHGNLMINSCSLCGLCKEVCPEDLHMGEVCKAARRTMVEQKRMPPSAHDFALRDLEFSNSEYFALARHQPSTESSAFVFFPGCQLSASSPENVKKTYAFLREKLEGGVGLVLRCCGAPADWSGRAALFSQTFADFESEWDKMGNPTLVLACSTCYSVFSQRLPREKVVSLWEVMDRVGLPEIERIEHAAPVAVHDPCTARHEPQIYTSVRNILQKLGCEIRELPLSRDKTECCSFGGLMYFANREVAEKVIHRRIGETTDDLLAYCAMCRDRYASEGKPTWHLLDLVFGNNASSAASMKGPDFSQRRENRARLKRSLLRQLWSEEAVKHEDYQDIKLEIDEQVRELMEKRMILVEDLQQVIQWAEKTGRRLVNRETGNFLAHYRPGTVTYWVEYTPGPDGYVIHNAYSHRMEIQEEIGQ